MEQPGSRGAAPGGPGFEPRWTTGRKDGAGTAYSSDSRIWFTLADGIVTEVFFPTVDMPQLRDLQILVTDGKSFLHGERDDLITSGQRLSEHALGFRIENREPEGRYSISKEIVSDPHLPVLLQQVKLDGAAAALAELELYVLAAPHLGVGGWGNSGYVIETAGRKVLIAEGGGTWLALGASVPFAAASCGFVGVNDGWTDLADNFHLDRQFDSAEKGNIALTGRLDLKGGREFTLALAFGHSRHSALTSLLQSLGVPFAEHRRRFREQWDRICGRLLPLEAASGDGGDLYHGSASLLLAHEDKTYPGAFIASVAIPWGDARSDEDRGGYHLVWTRDMVNSATGLLAAGNLDTPLRALIYLMASQLPDGGFPQNFWIDGQPYWQGIQLDEVAFPILLARHLRDAGALRNVDPYPMVKSAAAFLVKNGPATQQERWEEASGYSPSTLASCIAALIVAAGFARDQRDEDTACFLEDYADFIESHLERWTVTTEGSVHAEISRHFIRIHPLSVGDVYPQEDPNQGFLRIANLPWDGQSVFPAKEIVDAGFLELVRYGVRSAGDPLIVDSLRVVDAGLKVETPSGPCWRRYTHDGYGQGPGGAPFTGTGQGRAWPLLTGERGHYELAAGRDAREYLLAMEAFASECGLLPEQVWDEAGLPNAGLSFGGPTGSATPLAWAHAEYIKLLRSINDGKAFDLVPEVYERYVTRRNQQRIEVWKPNRRVRAVERGSAFRIQAPRPFRLHWSTDSWETAIDSDACETALGIHYADLVIPGDQSQPIRFTFYWTDTSEWEGSDFEVAIG